MKIGSLAGDSGTRQTHADTEDAVPRLGGNPPGLVQESPAAVAAPAIFMTNRSPAIPRRSLMRCPGAEATSSQTRTVLVGDAHFLQHLRGDVKVQVVPGVVAVDKEDALPASTARAVWTMVLGSGEANTLPAAAASARPSPTKKANIGSCPLPPPMTRGDLVPDLPHPQPGYAGHLLAGAAVGGEKAVQHLGGAGCRAVQYFFVISHPPDLRAGRRSPSWRGK